MTDNPNLCDHARIDLFLSELDHDQWNTRNVRALLGVDPLGGLVAELRRAVGEGNCALHDEFGHAWDDVAKQERVGHVATWCECLGWADRIHAAWGRGLPGKVWALKTLLFRAALERVDATREAPMRALERWEARQEAGVARVQMRRYDLVADEIRFVVESLVEEGALHPDDAAEIITRLEKIKHGSTA